MPWRRALACLLVVGGCMRAPAVVPPSPPEPVPSPAVVVDRRAPAVVMLRFDAIDRLAIDGVVEPVHGDGAAVLAGGVVVPLATRVADGARRAFAVEPTPSCPQPWLLDVAAAPVQAQPTIAGAPASLRVGCGPVQLAEFDTAFGRERVLVYGEAPFDARMVAAELGVVRSELEATFDVRIRQPWRTEILVEPPSGAMPPRAEATASGLRVRVDGAASWGPSTRLEAGATIARVWLAKHLGALAPELERTAPESTRQALLHGLARGIAREALFGLGLLSPDDYADDLDDAEQLVAERRHSWRVATVLDARDVAAMAAAVSVQAAMTAWALRERGHAANLPRALADEALVEAVPDALQLWARLLARVHGSSVPTTTEGLPGDPRPRRMGACIVPRTRRDRLADLGYTTAWSRQPDESVVTALAPDGAAARAGVRAGDGIRAVSHSGAGVTIEVQRGPTAHALQLTPRTLAVTRRTWVRRAEIADDRCYPSR